MRAGSLRIALVMVMLTAFCLAGAVAVSADAYRAKVRFPPAQEPSLYIEFLGGQLRVAASAEGVASATPIKASRKQISNQGRNSAYQSYSFPETVLPVAVPGLGKVSASFSFSRSVRIGKALRSAAEGQAEEDEFAYLSASFRLQKADREGVDWTFVYSGGGSAKMDQEFAEAPIVDVPTPGNLKLTVVTQVAQKKVGIGLRVQSGEVAFANVLKKAKPAEAEIEVTDKGGKVVHTQKGDLQKLGFT